VPVYNEEALLPHFLAHYAPIADRIVVWDNGSTDATPQIAREHPKVELRTFWSDGYDELSVLARLDQVKEESAGTFDWCLFPDCDEFVARRDGGDLQEILEQAVAEVLVPSGYCLVQHPTEGPLDLSGRILGQRRFGRTSQDYCKPIVVRPASLVCFALGKHRLFEIAPANVVCEPRLVLLHLEMVDYELWIYRKTRRPLSATNIRKGWCADRFCKSREFYEKYWSEVQGRAVNLVREIPLLGS
jgi:hypothetical protein